jgi:hypothetical protein
MSQYGNTINPTLDRSSIKPLRTYGELHRDFWRLIMQNPMVFMVFPTLIFLPTDIIIAFATSGMDTMEALRMSSRIQQISSLIFGTFAAAMMIWTIKEMANGRKPTFGESLRGGKQNWGAISITAFQVGWRVGLATLLLIVPGIVLAVRYSLAMPVTVFEDIHGKPAITRSKELGAGIQWPLFLSFFFSVFIYLPIVFALLFLLGHLAEKAGLGTWAEVVSSIPVNLAFAFMTIGTVFLYLEFKHPEKLQMMILNSDVASSQALSRGPAAYGAKGSSLTGLLPAVLAIVSWGGAGLFLVSYLGLGMFHLMAGNFFAEKGDLDKSRSYFQKAVELEPENPDYHFTLGSQYLHADKDNDKAIESFNKVIALDPKHGEAHLALSTAYYFKGDFETAKKHLAIAETLPIESADLLSTLKEDENMQR